MTEAINLAALCVHFIAMSIWVRAAYQLHKTRLEYRARMEVQKKRELI